VADRIRRLANALRALGIAPGDRVAWVGPNHPAFLESLFAAGSIGAALAPANHRLPTEQLRTVLDDADPAIVVLHQQEPDLVRGSGRPTIETGEAFEALVAGGSDAPVDVTVALDDLLLLPHTSGTTGPPKGVMLTHANVTWNVINFLSVADFRRDDVTVAIAPFFRVGGVGVNVLPVLFAGGTVVVPTDAGPEHLLELIGRHRVTVGFGNPDALEAIRASPAWTGADLSSVRFFLTGGAPVPERLIRSYLRRGVTLLQGYGLTEAAPLALLIDAEDALERVGSAGTPPLYVDIRIVDESGNEVVPGATGELLVRGPNVMAGYWRRPEDTARTIVDGWLRTGDAARADAGGSVWIVGRVADAFTVGGVLVHPGDVERVLGDHPAVADVGVVGPTETIPAPVAVVVPAANVAVTESELLGFVADRLRSERRPGSVVFVERVPRNSVGKLDRAKLRESALAASEADGRPVASDPLA
jgi:fatty-acyl-CoA synthase